MGPGATWSYIGAISPAIPAMHAVKDHMESEFGTASRGKHHTRPDKEKDVIMLCEAYEKAEIHIHTPRHKFGHSHDKFPDYVAKGVQLLIKGNVIEWWWEICSQQHETMEL